MADDGAWSDGARWQNFYIQNIGGIVGYNSTFAVSAAPPAWSVHREVATFWCEAHFSKSVLRRP